MWEREGTSCLECIQHINFLSMCIILGICIWIHKYSRFAEEGCIQLIPDISESEFDNPNSCNNNS